MQMMSQMSEQAAATQQAFQQTIETLRAEREADREETRTQIRALQTAVATPRHASPGEIANPVPQRIGPAQILDTMSPPLIAVTEEQRNIAYSKKKPTIPNPKLFDGNRRNFQAWQLAMESKLQVDGPALGGPADQFAYIYARLDQTPQSLAAAYFRRGGNDGNRNPAEFMEYLTSCYGDPHLKQRALNRLETMRQDEKESFAAFLPRFERELADSGGANWDDEIKINALRRVLNREMESYLIGQLTLPTAYPGFVNALQSLGANIEGHRFRNRKMERKQPFRRNANREEDSRDRQPTQPQKEETTDKMDWEPTKAGKVGSGKKSNDKPMTMTGPQCYSCGGYGHIARQCANERDKEAAGKKKPKDGKKASKAVRVKPKRETLSQIGEESDGDSDGQYNTASDHESEKE